MTLSSKKWRRPAMVFTVAGLLALAGYFLATNQRVREAVAARLLLPLRYTHSPIARYTLWRWENDTQF